jgi:phosphatidylglycerol:prolipoprotein diacylglycerol transferase
VSTASINVYGWMVLAGIALSALVWSRAGARGGAPQGRLTLVYFGGLLGALVGAQLAFLLADGWFHRGDWLALLSGRSITGGLLGGYAGVEVAKKLTGYSRATGDVFCVLVPMCLALGRVGCITAGCCPGVPVAPAWWAELDDQGLARWPAAATELAFNAAFLLWALAAGRWGWQRGNRFHVYMIAYGLFRFVHQFLRDDHHWLGALGGYHLLALAIVALGAWRYAQRRAALRPGDVAVPPLPPLAAV